MKVYRKLIRPVHCYPGQGYEPKTELVEKEEKWYPEEEREHLEEKYGYLNEGHFSDLIFEEKYEPYLLKERDAIVRCKDCRYGEPVKNGAGDDCIQCNSDDLWLDGSVNFPDWFCADGKRKNDDG